MQKIVLVRDIKANVYGQPMFVNSLGGAIRSFGDEILKADGNPFALHPEDYELYHYGEYDEATGSITPVSPMPQLALGSNFKSK
ncbi:nonstructural protein [Blackfly microvirus SF02]|uniref:Nonstructural protein n=1 Tax=Blackfly microvirus SF02 TaxID=2576452 RepID=A0A4P8PK87_9VIRU|nr:nonstructural protein [Blackfly microvirus SF02]